MKLVWKRVLLGAATIGLASVAAGEMHRAHAGAQTSMPTSPSTEPATQALKKQALQLQHEISLMKQRLQQSEKLDQSTVSSLTTLQTKAIALQKQLAAHEQAIALSKQLTPQNAAPVVQSVTRASGHSDDGGDHHGSSDD